MKNTVLTMLALSIAFVYTPSANACSVMQFDGRPAEVKLKEMEKDKILFVGTALNTEKTKNGVYYKTTFQVTKITKGFWSLWSGRVTINHFVPAGPCNTVYFTQGKSYTVSAIPLKDVKLFTDNRKVISH